MTHINPNTSIDALRLEGLLSIRAYNSLASARILTVGDILKYIQNGKDLMCIPNLGRKSVLEIKTILEKCVVEGEAGYSSEPYDNLENHLKELLSETFKAAIMNSQNLCGYLSVKYSHVGLWINKIIQRGKDEVLEIQPSLTRDENVAYRLWHIDLLNKILNKLETNSLSDSNLYEKFWFLLKELKKEYLEFTVAEIIRYFVSDENNSQLQEKYDALCKKYLNTRSLNFKQEYLQNYKDVVPYFEKPLVDYYQIGPIKATKKTLHEIYHLVQEFKSETFSSYDNYAIDEDFLNRSLKKEFPFFNDEQLDFVAKHILKYKRRPFFYLIYNYIYTSQKRECVYFSLYHGFYDGNEHTLEEIANKYKLTGERIRQIISNSDSYLINVPIKAEELNYYKAIITSHLITEDSSEFKKLIEIELLPNNFGIFGALCSLILNYEICNVLGYRVVMSQELRPYIEYRSLIQKFNRTLHQVKNSDNLFQYSYFTGEIPEEYNKDIQTLLTYLAKDKQNVSVSENGVTFGVSRIDIGQELYKILSQVGHPLYLEELFVRFKSIYPTHKFTKPIQIKRYIYENEHIQAIGKQHFYGLDCWDHIHYGTVNDILIELLEKSEYPIHINDLFTEVRKSYPSTSINSLKTSMGSDETKRFIFFEDDYIGLTTCQYPSFYQESKIYPRLKFEERIQSLQNFIETNHRFPIYNVDEEEASLARWFKRVTKGKIEISEQERNRLTAVLESYEDSGYPKNGSEYTFLTNCQKYKKFVEDNNSLPTNKNNIELYRWFYTAKKNLNDYNDQRYNYFKDLCIFITSRGFDIHL